MTISQKRFDVSHVQRVPVLVSQEAHAIMNCSHHQGRLMPLALSEAFGTLGNVAEVRISVEKKIAHMPFIDDAEASVFCIIVKHQYNKVSDHRYLTNVTELEHKHPVSKLPLFIARNMAHELVRLYPHKYIPVPSVEDSGAVEEVK